jgi:hypothetical protein
MYTCCSCCSSLPVYIYDYVSIREHTRAYVSICRRHWVGAHIVYLRLSVGPKVDNSRNSRLLLSLVAVACCACCSRKSRLLQSQQSLVAVACCACCGPFGPRVSECCECCECFVPLGPCHGALRDSPPTRAPYAPACFCWSS